MSQFNFNLIDLTHLEVVENLKTFLKGKEAISTVKVQNNDVFYVTIVIPEGINDVRMVDIVNNGSYDFEVKVSELYDIRAIENWFTSDDKEIIEVEHFLAYDAIKYVCRHWDEL